MNILFGLLLLSAAAMAKTEVSFVDACSEKELKVSNPNGTRLLIKIDNLNPQDWVETTVVFRPAGVVEDLKPNEQVTYKFNFSPYKQMRPDGSIRVLINIPKERWMWQVEQNHAEYRIWDAEVTWVQPLSKKAGSDISSMYHAPNEQAYYQVLSESLCQWEAEAEVSSKLYENLSNTFMNITREKVETWDQGNGPGMTLGYNNNTGGSVPLSPSGQSNAITGWLFKDWQSQRNNHQIFRVERKYVLNREETGVFISRFSFNRHQVKRFEWREEANTCGDFVAVSEGFLDIGRNSEDFVVLPKTYHPRPEQLKQFINTVRPAINNCGSHEMNGPQDASDIIPTGMDGILYYYQLQHNRGIE